MTVRVRPTAGRPETVSDQGSGALPQRGGPTGCRTGAVFAAEPVGTPADGASPGIRAGPTGAEGSVLSQEGQRGIRPAETEIRQFIGNLHEAAVAVGLELVGLRDGTET
jgi:hypothetical protein